MKVMSGPGGGETGRKKSLGKLTYGKHRLHCLAPHTLVLSFCMSRFWISCWRAGVDGKRWTGRMGSSASEVIASSSCNVYRATTDIHSHPLPSPPAPLISTHPTKEEQTPPFQHVLSYPLPSPSICSGLVSKNKPKPKQNRRGQNKE